MWTKAELGEWAAIVEQVADEPWHYALCEQVEAAYAAGEPQVFPPREDLFSALRLTPPEQVKCVIVGQDPYHGTGQANGLAFSVREGMKFPPSLRNIFRELQEDVGSMAPNSGNLTRWAKQGVLLLNNVLTVYEGKANSHKRWGWQNFTDHLLCACNELPQPISVILWGKEAQKKGCFLSESRFPRLVIQSNHPSPLSAYRGFFGSRPFSKTNQFLEENGVSPIDWSLNAQNCPR